MSLALLLTALPLALPPQEPDPRPLTSGQIEDAVDSSLRWLRGRQDESGGYGDLPATIAVLEALTLSHRAYRPTDGPFVAAALERLLSLQQEDGSFLAPGGSWDARQTTLRALWILEHLDADAAAAGRARAFLGEAYEASSLLLLDVGERPDVAAFLGSEAASILAPRAGDGSWNGDVLRTAELTVQLTAIARALETREAPKDIGVATPLPTFSAADRGRSNKALLRGTAFLLAQTVEPGRWGFQGHADPGITAMVAGALLAAPEPRGAASAEAIDAALDWLVSLQKEDGSIHAGQLANYVTAASVMALARAGREKDAEVIARARDYLRVLQSDEGEGYGSADRFYGGVGYGGDERPDLSNLQMALEALNASGLPAGDETFQKALTFLQRCQNRSESNDLALADGDATIVSGNDGGAGYAPGDSKAGFVELRDGRKVPRSYGSMTYALLKGYLFAGLPRDDPRVEAAWEWLSTRYTLDVNPGFESSPDPTAAYQGLFYYFTTMAKALDLYGEEVVVDGAGVEHAWRAELAGRMVALQRQDGSWINDNAPRWYEGNPVLATAYAMLTLGTALPE
jgi:squalene-hopene/tetraprenyl-beta-curcumene cyclase